MILFIFGIIVYVYFNNDWREEEFNEAAHHNFLISVTLTIKEGLRYEEGIGKALEPASPLSTSYWGRYALDIIFFSIINAIYIEIIFSTLTIFINISNLFFL